MPEITKPRAFTLLAAVLALGALACTCGPLAALSGDLQATAQGAADRSGPTLEARLTQFAPTYAAEATTLVESVTDSAPSYFASVTAVVMTADAAGRRGQSGASNVTPTPTSEPSSGGAPPPTNTPPPPPTNTPAAVSAGSEPIYTGGDSNDTALVERMTIGESRTASIEDVFNAHNWLFDAQAGQTVAISVVGSGDTDPAARLIDPAGNTITYQQDSGGGVNVSMQATLEVAGTYTVRVDVWVPGEYTITISTP